VPGCQDTGIYVFFARLGTDFPVNGGQPAPPCGGIAVASERHDLCSSVVHPIARANGQDSTDIPDFHVELVNGGALFVIMDSHRNLGVRAGAAAHRSNMAEA